MARAFAATAAAAVALAAAAASTGPADSALAAWYTSLPAATLARRQAPAVDPRSAPRHPAGNYTPVVLMHGLGDAGSNPGMQSLAESLEKTYPGMYATAVDVADGLFSYFVPMQDQVDEFATTVRADPRLAGGFNAIGLSQGGLVVRGYIEQYNDPPVHRFVSICGVQGGEFNCPLELQILPFVCEIFELDPYRFLFNGSIPLAFADYWVTYDNQTLYLSENTFLPPLNNEVHTANSSTYKSNFASLTKLALVEATEDTVVYPYVSEQFGGYVWNTTNATTYNFFTSAHYTQDLIGLRTLYTAGKVDLLSFKGDHLRFNNSYWDTVILPYFDN